MSADLAALRKQHDKGDMYARVAGFPEQLEKAWEIGREFAAELAPGRFSRVAVCGMGGSAIGGDMARSFLGDRLTVPLVSSRDYHLPRGFGGDGALVVVSSYSGNTAETLSAFDQAVASGATVVAITSGGEVAQRCGKAGLPACIIPGGMPPRSALGYSLMPLLQVLRAAGVAAFDNAEFDEALDAVRRLGEACALDSGDNPAVGLAASLAGATPFVYAGPGLMEAVARRWAGQLNENAKTLAHWAVYSELNHNEIVGWEELERRRFDVEVVALEDPDDHAGTKRQMDVGLEIVKPLARAVHVIAPEKGGRLARMLANVVLGDFVSVYLAYRNGVDPTPVAKIDHLKRQL